MHLTIIKQVTYRIEVGHGSGFEHERHLNLQINKSGFSLIRLKVELFEGCGGLDKVVN